MVSRLWLNVCVVGGLLAVACSGPQSALNPAGEDATEIATLFWWMSGGAALIWLLMMALTFYSVFGPRLAQAHRVGHWLIVGGGVVLPVVVLVPLLAIGLAPLSRAGAHRSDGAITIDVSGEQWWWRVRYHTPAQRAVDVANEIRLPVGVRVDLRLTSDNVIHAFWIPSLAGKIDMIPGRTTELSLRPTRVGRFRGVCAEYCGTAHALMAFDVEVLGRDEFDRWLDRQAAPAAEPVEVSERRGRERFDANGCGACHSIRGTSSRGGVGPDLTHVGGRFSLAAGTQPNSREALASFIAHAGAHKPGAEMPSFAMLPAEEIADMAAYLRGLE